MWTSATGFFAQMSPVVYLVVGLLFAFWIIEEIVEAMKEARDAVRLGGLELNYKRGRVESFMDDYGKEDKREDIKNVYNEGDIEY